MFELARIRDYLAKALEVARHRDTFDLQLRHAVFCRREHLLRPVLGIGEGVVRALLCLVQHISGLAFCRQSHFAGIGGCAAHNAVVLGARGIELLL